MKKSVAVAEPEPQESLLTVRKRETLARVHELKKQIDAHEAKLAQFRLHNFTNINGRLTWKLGSLTGKETAERELIALCKTRDKILAEWSAALADYAKLSQQKF